MNEEQIKKLIEFTFEYCKKEYAKQEERTKDFPYDHEDYKMENHMMGYHKGRLSLMENITAAIQWN